MTILRYGHELELSLYPYRSHCSPPDLQTLYSDRPPRADMADNAANWNSFLDHAALTDVGLRRANNQDCHMIVRASEEQSWRQRGDLFMVADGMGAHAAGELASKLASDSIGHAYFKLTD